MPRVANNWGLAPSFGCDCHVGADVPPNWGLAPTFGDDLLFEGPIAKPKVGSTDEARAVGVPPAMLNARFTDKQVESMTPHRWMLYRKVLRYRGQHNEVTRLSNLRNIASERAKCPDRWNPKTGCQERKWYMKARDTGQEVLHEVASSPITQAAFTVASFTPLAPIAVPVGVGLQAADRLSQGKGLDVEGLSALAAQSIGVPPGAVPVATEIGKMALTQELDAEGLALAAAKASGLPPGAVEIGSAAVRGDWEAVSGEAARALGVPDGAVPVGVAVARGDTRGALKGAARAAGVPTSAKGLSRAAANAIGVPEGAVPVSDVKRAARKGGAAAKAAQRARKRAANLARRDRLRAPVGNSLPPAVRSLINRRF